MVEKSPPSKIGPAKRQKTVRQKGEIRTSSNQEKAFRGRCSAFRGSLPTAAGRQEEKEGLCRRGKPALEDETPQGGLGKGKERLQYPESSFTAILPRGLFGGLPEVRAAARRGTLAA